MRDVLEKGAGNQSREQVMARLEENIFRGERAEADKAIGGEGKGRCFLYGQRSK